MQLKQEWIYWKSLRDKFIIVLILIQNKKIRKIPFVFGAGPETIGDVEIELEFKVEGVNEKVYVKACNHSGFLVGIGK
jgi:hypothetical protein